MNPLLRRITIFTTVAGCTLLGIGVLAFAVGARINTSRSIPVGLYWTSDAPANKGSYVLACPPQVGVIAEAKRRGYLTAGFCPGDYGYLMKKILAVNGDAISVTGAGVSVNGELLPYSSPLPFDAAGRALPRYQSDDFILGNSEVLLMSDVSGTSFDGRYFGPVNRTQVKTVIVPVLTW